MTALDDLTLALADRVGRLRRRVDPGSYDGLLVAQLAGLVETLDAQVQPCAAELVRDLVAECAGDEDVAVEVALDLVDGRAAQLRRLLGADAVGEEWPWTRAA